MATRRSGATRPPSDWSRDPLPPTRWAGAAEPAPATAALVRAAVAESGADPAAVDKELAARYARQLIIHSAHDLFRQTGNCSGARALLLVSLRVDLGDEMLWNFFTHQDANGVAVRNHLIGSYLGGGEVTASLVGGIRDGSLLRTGA